MLSHSRHTGLPSLLAFKTYVLSIYCAPGNVLDTWGTSVNKTENTSSHKIYCSCYFLFLVCLPQSFAKSGFSSSFKSWLKHYLLQGDFPNHTFWSSTHSPGHYVFHHLSLIDPPTERWMRTEARDLERHPEECLQLLENVLARVKRNPLFAFLSLPVNLTHWDGSL